jgi:hypothetical protein
MRVFSGVRGRNPYRRLGCTGHPLPAVNAIRNKHP